MAINEIADVCVNYQNIVSDVYNKYKAEFDACSVATDVFNIPEVAMVCKNKIIRWSGKVAAVGNVISTLYDNSGLQMEVVFNIGEKDIYVYFTTKDSKSAIEDDIKYSISIAIKRAKDFVESAEKILV